MNTIAIVSRKGGVGKTTLTIHFAVEVGLRGETSVILDMDEQSSASAWYKLRESETPLLLQSNVEGLTEHLETCEEEGVDVVLIDTPPQAEGPAKIAAAHADLILIPARASALDLLAIGATVELVSRLGKPAAIVLTQVPPRGMDGLEARRALKQYGLPLCPVDLVERVAFRRPLIGGLTAQEDRPTGKATREVKKAWDWVCKQLEG